LAETVSVLMEISVFGKADVRQKYLTIKPWN